MKRFQVVQDIADCRKCPNAKALSIARDSSNRLGLSLWYCRAPQMHAAMHPDEGEKGYQLRFTVVGKGNVGKDPTMPFPDWCPLEEAPEGTENNDS